MRLARCAGESGWKGDRYESAGSCAAAQGTFEFQRQFTDGLENFRTANLKDRCLGAKRSTRRPRFHKLPFHGAQSQQLYGHAGHLGAQHGTVCIGHLRLLGRRVKQLAHVLEQAKLRTRVGDGNAFLAE